MAAHDHDRESDVIQWGMSLLEVGPPFYSGYYGRDPHHQHEEHYDTADSYHVDNGEIAAAGLHEDFAQLSVRESSGYSHKQEAESYSRHSFYGGNDWPTTSSTSYNSSDHDRTNEDSDDTVSSSLCSSPSYGDRRTSYSSELTDDCRLDNEVGNVFNQLIPIRHLPKLNGEIPSFDEVASDHERLLNRIQAFGFVEVKVQGDGNCQFRALSDQLYGTPDSHKVVRREIVKQLKSNPEMYEGYVPMKYSEYLRNVSRSGEWGDHVTLQAAADSYLVKILVMTSFKDTCYIEILPQKKKPKKVIFLSFWAEVHYNAIYFRSRETAPSVPDKKKKRRWMFGKKH